jgi:hypothetical protein
MKRQLILMVLPVLLAACGSTTQNANLGPDAGGGFDCPHHAFQGCVNPQPGSVPSPSFVTKAQTEH